MCVQAVAGLRLGHLGQVSEEELQGEPVMQGYGGGVLDNQAHLSVLAFTQSAIWKRYSDGFSLHQTHTDAVRGLTQSAGKARRPVSADDSRVKVKIAVSFVQRRTSWSISGILQ